MNQKVPSLPIRILVSFIANFVLIVLVSMLFGENVQATFLGEIPAAEPNMALLGGGTLLMSILLALLYPSLKIQVGSGWFMNALPVAVLMGLSIYFCTHMVQAGYTTINSTGWLLEGLYDSLAPMASILAMAALTNRQNK